MRYIYLLPKMNKQGVHGTDLQDSSKGMASEIENK